MPASVSGPEDPAPHTLFGVDFLVKHFSGTSPCPLGAAVDINAGT